MKTQSWKLVSLLAVFTLSFACSDADKTASKAKQNEEKEAVHKTQPSFFPFIVAGSITIIQKVYLKKAE